MSVKDKIAMWNSMAAPNNNSNNTLNTKMTNSEHVQKPKEPDAEKKQQIPPQKQE